MKVYLSSSSLNLERLEELKVAGFEGWEVIAEGTQRLDRPVLALIDYVTSSYGLEISVHTPYSDLNVASLNQPIWLETLRQIKQTMALLADYAHIFVVHPGYVSPLAAHFPDRALKKNCGALSDIARCAEEYGVKATVENMANVPSFIGRSPQEIATMLVDGLGFTLDVGHANTTNTIDSLLKMPIHHIHLHDNNGKSDEHLILGGGNIDWKRIIHELRRYRGVYVLEMKSLGEGVQSLAYLSRLRASTYRG